MVFLIEKKINFLSHNEEIHRVRLQPTQTGTGGAIYYMWFLWGSNLGPSVCKAYGLVGSDNCCIMDPWESIRAGYFDALIH